MSQNTRSSTPLDRRQGPRRPLAPALALALVLPASAASAAGPVLPPPAEVFGHVVGADRQLVPYPQVVEYIESVAAASDRVSIESAGRSTLGNPMPVVVLSSPANQARLDELRGVAERLARPAGLVPEEAERLVEEGRSIALVTCTIHATEVGCTQMATEFVHEFATTQDPERLAWMEEAILLLMPSINPDGQILVRDWYERWLGTDYEGGRMPWLYHHYVGHDNNRDFYMLTQKESRVVNDVLYHRWFPQVYLDEHQMGSTGPRMFVPPQTDPLAPEVHSLVFRQADLLGTNMGRRLEEAGKRGVGNDMIFDAYWPGGTRNTAWWKNITGLLTEVASARIATPIYIDPGELRGGYKGLPEYVRRANFPSPWPGGWWRLRDIVEYELIATWALLESVAEERRELLHNTYAMASGEITRGGSEAPYAFVVPPGQHDPVAAGRLEELLLRHGVELSRALEPLRSGHAVYPAGTTVISAAQPYRPFLLTMLRPQRFPEVLDAVEGDILPPYDVTSWSLPLSMGVEVVEIEEPVTAALEPLDAPTWPEAKIDVDATGHLLPHAADSVFTAMNRLLAAGQDVYWLAADAKRQPGDVYIPGAEGAQVLQEMSAAVHVPVSPIAPPPQGAAWKVSAARVGLYKPWVASMDEGWTRWLLEQYEFPFVNVDNAALRDGSFTRDVDVLLLPDVDPAIIARGRPEEGRSRRPFRPLPPEWAGGIDEWLEEAETKKSKRRQDTPGGGDHLKEWVRDGGSIVALDSSTQYLIELFELPVADVLEDVGQDRFLCPGSLLRLVMDTAHPLTFGMRPRELGYFGRSPAFRTRLPGPAIERHVVARYPDDERDILASGFLKGGALLERRAAVVELGVGDGRIVLIGFHAQQRAQPLRTFKLLFNALYQLESTTLPTDHHRPAEPTPDP